MTATETKAVLVMMMANAVKPISRGNVGSIDISSKIKNCKDTCLIRALMRILHALRFAARTWQALRRKGEVCKGERSGFDFGDCACYRMCR